jgi:hypothetical protein
MNYGSCISASRPDRITPGTHWIGGSSDKNGVYPTTQLLFNLILSLIASLTRARSKQLHLFAILKIKVTLRPTTSRSVRLGFQPHLGLMTRY